MLILKFDRKKLNIGKFHSELAKEVSEQFALTHNETEFMLYFKDLKEINFTTLNDDGEEIIKSETVKLIKTLKIVIEKIMNEFEVEEDVEKEIEVVTEETFDLDELKSKIQEVIDSHDITPLPKPKTELELMQEAIDFLIMGGM